MSTAPSAHWPASVEGLRSRSWALRGRLSLPLSRLLLCPGLLLREACAACLCTVSGPRPPWCCISPGRGRAGGHTAPGLRLDFVTHRLEQALLPLPASVCLSSGDGGAYRRCPPGTAVPAPASPSLPDPLDHSPLCTPSLLLPPSRALPLGKKGLSWWRGLFHRGLWKGPSEAGMPLAPTCLRWGATLNQRSSWPWLSLVGQRSAQLQEGPSLCQLSLRSAPARQKEDSSLAPCSRKAGMLGRQLLSTTPLLSGPCFHHPPSKAESPEHPMPQSAHRWCASWHPWECPLKLRASQDEHQPRRPLTGAPTGPAPVFRGRVETSFVW